MNKFGWLLLGAVFTVGAWADNGVEAKEQAETVSVKYYCTRDGSSSYPFSLKYVVVAYGGQKIEAGIVSNYDGWSACVEAAKAANASLSR